MTYSNYAFLTRYQRIECFRRQIKFELASIFNLSVLVYKLLPKGYAPHISRFSF